jgi:hypothetical protein
MNVAQSEFVDELASRISVLRSPRARRARLGFAGVLTAAMLTALAAFGGIGYAATALRNTINAPAHVVKQISQPTKAISAANIGSNELTSAGDEYKPGCGSGDKNHIHTGPPGDHNGFPGICPPHAGGGDHVKCNSGRGNGSEQPGSGGIGVNGLPNDCDPGNSGPVNHGGD